jgi:hypothetical protein
MKTFTLGLMIFCVAMVIGQGWIVGPKPADSASKLVHKAYALKFFTYGFTLGLAVVVLMVCGLVLLRKAREDYRVEKLRLMQDLVEGSLQDHAKKSDDE